MTHVYRVRHTCLMSNLSNEPDNMRNDIVVLGLGNPLMADEGIGGFIINKLLEKKDSYPEVDFLDAGTAFSAEH